jgi:hypothetical protein
MVVLLCALAASAFAQGVQTGVLRGVVHDEQGLAMPGVTVTVTSPSVQGRRSTVTDTRGGFTLANLPAGDYEVVFELSTFSTVKRTTSVLVGLVVEQHVTLKPAGLAESVQVVAETPAAIASPVMGGNYRHEEIDALATPRSLQGIATLAPAVSQYSPNAGQLIINGAFAFDNIFMINGVDVNDNLFATPQALFIEDAIQETQVLTSGISAEYGRFTGGVINAITRSGGNAFSGSFRTNFFNPAWTDETPYEKERDIERLDKLQETYEGTFGGPILRDRLWFFTAGRYAKTESSDTLPETATAITRPQEQKRAEIKLTGTLAENHTIQGGYLNRSLTAENTSGAYSYIIDPRSLATQEEPNWYYFNTYRGVFGSNLLIDAQYSERRFEFKGGGGTSPALTDSPIWTLGTLKIYNGPYFDASDPEQRNNRQFTGSVAYYLQRGGRHEIKGGYEFFRSQHTGGNSQSASQFVYDADYLTDASGLPVYDSQNRLIPVFEPGASYIEFWPAIKGAEMNVDNNSLYVQDHWTVGNRWSFDVGTRFEKVNVDSTGNISSIDTSRIVPRLAAALDVQGNGTHVIHATYGWYSGRYNEAQIGGNSPVGNPAGIYAFYAGPAGQGVDFAPGFAVANYPLTPDNAAVIQAPTANVFNDPDLKSAVVKEFTTSYGLNFGTGKGYAEIGYVHRDADDLIEDFQTLSEGFTHVVVAGVDAGLATNKVFRNTDLAHRVYDAMIFQSRYSITPDWSVNGHYTVQLRNEGNYEGEATNAPGATSIIGQYPEAFSAARNYPDGRLQDYQQHRMRLWSIYNLDMGGWGHASFSGMWRVDSGRVYSLLAPNQPLTATQRTILRNAGYVDAPVTQTVYFDGRGSETGKGYGLLDTSINYNVPVFRSLRPWLKFDTFNLFNNDKLIFWNQTVRQDASTPADSLGLRTGYVKGSLFGQATSPAHFPGWSADQNGGRTFRVALGLRF